MAKKAHKLDPHLVSSETWELDYVSQKFKVTRKAVRFAIKQVGNSRRRVYAWIRENFSLHFNEE